MAVVASAVVCGFLFVALKFSEVAPLLGTLLSGGFLGGILAWRKSGAEVDSIATTATRTAVEVFESSISRLQQDLGASEAQANILQIKIVALTRQLDDVSAQLVRVKSDATAVLFERDHYREHAKRSDERVRELEARVRELEEGAG